MRSPRRPAVLLAVPLTLLALAGCGTTPSGPTGTTGATDLTETTTPEALAGAVLTHLDVEPIAVWEQEPIPGSPDDAVAVGMRVPMDDGDTEGALLTVSTASGPLGEDAACPEDLAQYDGCREDDEDDATTLLLWQAEEPEEDPGIVLLGAERAGLDSGVQVYLAGPLVPEELDDDTDLPPTSVDGLRRIALDPAVGPVTTPAAVEAGERIGDELWTDGDSPWG